MKHCFGFPVYGREYKTKVFEKSLTSASDIPNPSGADVGTAMDFDSVSGCKSGNSGTDAQDQIYYDGPYSSKPTTAWSNKDAVIDATRGFTFAFEVERAAFERTTSDIAGTDNCALFQFRAAANDGFLEFGRNGVAGDTTFDYKLSIGHAGVATSAAYLSKYANDKPYVPVHISVHRGRCDVYVDGHHCLRLAVSANAAGDFDDMYLVGRQYTKSSTPAGFPWYVRNMQFLMQPIILPIHPLYDRIAIVGDSVASQGDYYINSPRYSATHDGTNADAGICPMLERLMHRRGIYTSNIHNSGRVGARMLYVATANDVLDQVDGTNVGTDFDANAVGSRIAVVHCGLNDVTNEVSTIANIKAAARTVIRTMLDSNFEHIVLCNVYDAQGSTSKSNSAAVVATRTADINTAYDELAAEFSNVYLCDVHTAFGGTTQNADYFRADLTHPKEEGQALLGRTVYNTLASNVFKA